MKKSGEQENKKLILPSTEVTRNWKNSKMYGGKTSYGGYSHHHPRVVSHLGYLTRLAKWEGKVQEVAV